PRIRMRFVSANALQNACKLTDFRWAPSVPSRVRRRRNYPGDCRNCCCCVRATTVVKERLMIVERDLSFRKKGFDDLGSLRPSKMKATRIAECSTKHRLTF